MNTNQIIQFLNNIHSRFLENTIIVEDSVSKRQKEIFRYGNSLSISIRDVNSLNITDISIKEFLEKYKDSQWEIKNFTVCTKCEEYPAFYKSERVEVLWKHNPKEDKQVDKPISWGESTDIEYLCIDCKNEIWG
jgi:hypothetical protein